MHITMKLSALSEKLYTINLTWFDSGPLFLWHPVVFEFLPSSVEQHPGSLTPRSRLEISQLVRRHYFARTCGSTNRNSNRRNTSVYISKPSALKMINTVVVVRTLLVKTHNEKRSVAIPKCQVVWFNTVLYST
mgnify:FL=1